MITALKKNKRCSDSMVTEIMRIHLNQKVFVAPPPEASGSSVAG
jgi:hypothetical protein